MDAGGFVIEDETKDIPEEGRISYQQSVQNAKKGFESDVLAQGDISNARVGQGRPKKTDKIRPRACRPTNPPFDTRRYVEIVLRFDVLKNIETEELPLPGQYVIRASCMGKTYGHFVSQSVDLHSIALFARADPMHPHCPDVIVDEEFLFYIRFKDIIDNPILLSLLDSCPNGVSTTNYDKLKPIGYICLDTASILDFQHGYIEDHIEPWIIPDNKILKTFRQGQPSLQLRIDCQRGMPTKVQLRQGNIMNVFVESMSHLPPEILEATSDPKNNPQVDVMLTLPHSEKQPFLEFPGGKYDDGNFIEPPLTLRKTLDEATQTGDYLTNSVDLSNRYAPTRHWASIPEHWDNIPVKATAISTVLAPEVEDYSVEIFGDAAEAYEKAVGYCQEPKIVWDAQHKRYIPVESYKKMLTRLSQDVVWPLEVAVTLQKSQRVKSMHSKPDMEILEPKSKKLRRKSKQVNDDSEDKGPVLTDSFNSNKSEDNAEESEIFYLDELGKTPVSESLLVYHGIAFVDLSRLVYPGVEKARFACRLYPFSEQLLQSKTCMAKSAFAAALEGMSTMTEFDKKVKKPLHDDNDSVNGSLLNEDPNKPEIGPGECFPIIVLEINLKRSIIPLYKSLEEIPEFVQDYIPPREISRRKLINAGIAMQRFRRAAVEAAAEISSEFTNHYWKDVVLSGQESQDNPQTPLPTSTDTLKKGFVFYLNASGRYLVLREHLRQAVSNIVQQRCLNTRPSGFETHRDFQSFLADMYSFLMDEVHEAIRRTSMYEVDPLEPIPNPPKNICSPEDPISIKKLEQKALLRELLFYAEEAYAQGDFDCSHKLHLQRICRSMEDSNCWVDFTIMWMKRGDDRMAEMAAREALRNNDKNIYALLMGGLIAIRHNDDRGIDCIGSALGLKPLNPEIMVILALAHAQVGNEMGSDFFFRKAAYTHRALTGQDVGDLDKTFDTISKSVGIKQSVKNIAKAQEFVKKEVSISITEPEKEQENQKSLPNLKQSVPKMDSIMNKKRGSNASKHSEGRLQKLSDTHRLSLDINAHPSDKVKHVRGSIGEPTVIKTDVPLPADDEMLLDGREEETPDDDDFYTRKNSISRRSTGRHSASTYKPRFDFMAEISDITMSDVTLPPLRPSIQIPWNATEFSDKLKGFLDAANNIPTSSTKTNTDIDEDNIATDEVIKAEYDKIIREQSLSKEVVIDPSYEKKRSVVGTTSDKSKVDVEALRTSIGKGSKASLKDTTSSVKDVPQKCMGNQRPVFDRRLGSELIWTAQLLLELRMFDMLDGVLARELYVTATRSIQFLYLRAMSLYLRQCYRDAIPLLDEAIELDLENAALWIVKGHCYYKLGLTAEASECYEKVLTLPVGKENRHLVYLRYGTLTLDDGNCESAKRIFLHGIQKYPTPYMWLATGNTCYMMKDFDQAEAAFTEANRLDNTNPITWAHLALINLAQGQRDLAEQSYKWALRFGLRKGKILDEIKRLQQEKGFGDPSFPRIPNCIPHDYYVRRLGRQKPFDIYRDALINEPPSNGKKRFEDTEREKELKERLKQISTSGTEKEVPPEVEIEVLEASGETRLSHAEHAEVETNVKKSTDLEPILIEVSSPITSHHSDHNTGKNLADKHSIDTTGSKKDQSQSNTGRKSIQTHETGKGPARKSIEVNVAAKTGGHNNAPSASARSRKKSVNSKKSIKKGSIASAK